jgi:hypothetical protein
VQFDEVLERRLVGNEHSFPDSERNVGVLSIECRVDIVSSKNEPKVGRDWWVGCLECDGIDTISIVT